MESSLQAQASAFCSAYIEQTATQIVTVYPTTTAGTATITDTITVDITVTDTSNIIDTVTTWYSSTDIAPVTLTSVVEDVVQTTEFITTTDATAISTAIDAVTTTVTDTTLTSTVVSTDDITTTDTTVYATQTATLSMTITDSTVINTVTSVQTATVTLAQRSVEIETVDDQEEEEEFDDCGEPEPECTSSECLFSSWLAEVSTIATSDLSSACSCLVVPATTTTTIVTTASQSTAVCLALPPFPFPFPSMSKSTDHYKQPSIFVTATSRVTAYQTQVSSRHVIVSASTIIDETSSIPLFVTRTRTTPTTKYVYATASSYATVTRIATNDQTASTRVTSVESVTIDETASATTTITATATILETASSTVSITETTTATITPTACAQLSSPYYDSAYGVEVYIDCNYEYSYSSSKIVGLDLYVTFIECVNACAAKSTCNYLEYDRSSSECFLLSGVISGQAESGIDTAVVSR
ncbi:hypothetical protein N7520_003241 [Penicillium odoratum]|uniref:uncharacterized protein n=1 Tax=Penicillium odoratum TaxID=1167516 RepID=UPI002549B27F|nr:uncharacterized protein N7520_003241 [Penicillium odoratum]KAJ5772712.1 hypothetical protein N7520_003241 [Penicillium odoratum]